MMIALAFVSGTAVAAATCRHQNAQAHAAALHGSDAREAASARHEDSAASTASKQGVPVDAGSFSLPAFVIPSPYAPADLVSDRLAHLPAADAAKHGLFSIPPPLKPPAA